MQSPLMDRAMSASPLKPCYLLAILCGAALLLAIVKLPASSPQPLHHVYELRLYHVNEGKMDALKARFGNHTDSIFKRHNMKSIGYWSSEDAPSFSEPVYLYSGASQPSRGGEELGRFPSRSGMAEGEGRIGGARGTGGPYRPVFHGPNQLFSAELIEKFHDLLDRVPIARGHQPSPRLRLGKPGKA